MLEPKGDGMMMGGTEAIEFLETLAEMIPDEDQDKEFSEKFKRSLNRFRYEVRKSIPVKPNVIKAVHKCHHDRYQCRKCGTTLYDGVGDNFCRHCGTGIKWDNPRCLTK